MSSLFKHHMHIAYTVLLLHNYSKDSWRPVSWPHMIVANAGFLHIHIQNWSLLPLKLHLLNTFKHLTATELINHNHIMLPNPFVFRNIWIDTKKKRKKKLQPVSCILNAQSRTWNTSNLLYQINIQKQISKFLFLFLFLNFSS